MKPLTHPHHSGERSAPLRRGQLLLAAPGCLLWHRDRQSEAFRRASGTSRRYLISVNICDFFLGGILNRPIGEVAGGVRQVGSVGQCRESQQSPALAVPDPQRQRSGTFSKKTVCPISSDHITVIAMPSDRAPQPAQFAQSWPLILAILTTVPVNGDNPLIPVAFKSVQFICSDFLPHLPVGAHPITTFFDLPV